MIASTVVYPVLLALLSILSAADEYDFLYYIYYSDAECLEQTAGVVGKVAGEAFVGVGGKSAEQICAEEAICLMDDQSESCQKLERTANGTVNLDVDDFGVIVECDKTNTDEPQCAPMPRDCLTSSVFPSCRFRLRSQKDLIERTDELLSNQNGEDLATHSYMIFFKDDKCSDLAGMKGLVSGTTSLTTVDDSIPCNKALTCILAPQGEACLTIDEAARSSKVVVAETTKDGYQVLSCIDDGSCEFVSDGCVKSDILASCYVKWVGPAALFEQPLVHMKGESNGGSGNAVGGILPKEDNSETSPTSSAAISCNGFASVVIALVAYVL
jgi:hypothetical protein